jgi:hypothetical protein
MLLVPASGGAAPGDTRSERDRVRQERAAVAAQVDVLEASNAEVEAALDALNANVAGAEAALGDAQRAVSEAEAALADARARETATLADIEARRGQLRELAIDAYMYGGSDDQALALLDSRDIDEAVQRQALVELRAGQYTDVVSDLRSLSEDLAIIRGEAETAAATAEAQRQEVSARLDEVQAARDQQAAVADEVDRRLDAALSEAAGLAELDSQLSARLAAEQAAIAARNRGRGGGGGTGSSSITGNTNLGNVSLATVSCPAGGAITVASSISGQLQSLLNAAAGDGINLCGGGYRSSDAQIALRRAHCGSSDYAIYEMSPSSCSPPTARPGASMHEQGLAVDFTCNGGGAISSRSSPCFQWLSANAGGYGFRNLPSEPWHWSVNGN